MGVMRRRILHTGIILAVAVTLGLALAIAFGLPADAATYSQCYESRYLDGAICWVHYDWWERYVLILTDHWQFFPRWHVA